VSFLPAIVLAALAFAAAAFVLRMPRSAWALFGAALLFGLAGYALQGSPGEAGAPRTAIEDADNSGEALVDARRELFGTGRPPSHFVTVADGFARRGQYADAAGILTGATRENPDDVEAWIALGNALVEHAEGQLTPAALYAYGRAESLKPEHPAAPFFLGVALIRGGRMAEARQLWADLLARAPADAEWRPALKERLERLDVLIAQVGGQ
jgi:cytochrome c-type biogenesis protein CcmH